MSEIFNGLQNNKNRSSLFIIVLLTFFSASSVFGQNESLEVSSNGEEISVQNKVVIDSPAKESGSVNVNSNVNFILWFMGTKEDMGKTFSSDDVYSKKSFLTSGREPNRLLMKTLLKKALNIKSC